MRYAWRHPHVWALRRQAGSLRAFPPEGMQMMLALWGIFTFMLFIQTLVMNFCLQVRPPGVL